LFNYSETGKLRRLSNKISGESCPVIANGQISNIEKADRMPNAAKYLHA
jgi:hypothetical protein